MTGPGGLRLDASEPVAAPPGAVFAAVSDFDRLAARLGPGRVRLTETDAVGDSRAWRAEIVLHGIVRRGQVRLAALDAPHGYVLRGGIDGVSAGLTVAVVPAGAAASRLDVCIEAAPRTLPGRVLLKPLKLVRENLRVRLSARLARLAREIEAEGA